MANLDIRPASLRFREEVQNKIIDNLDAFWDDVMALKPKDRCDVMLKMMAFGFAKPPEEKPLGEDERGRIILEETKRKATLISGGIPQTKKEIEDGTVLDDN